MLTIRTELVFSPLSRLYSALSTSNDEEASFQPSRILPFVLGTPTTLVFALNDTRLVISTVQGQVHVFDATTLLTDGSGDIQPLRSFPSPATGGPRQVVSNPGDNPELIAVLHETDAEVIDVQKLEAVAGWRGGGTPETTPSTCKSRLLYRFVLAVIAC
jgi:nucleoporin NUP159